MISTLAVSIGALDQQGRVFGRRNDISHGAGGTRL